MNSPLIKKLNLAMCDKSPTLRLACRIVLGRELHHLKQALGYEGGGTYWSFRDQFKPSERLTWPQYCLAQAGISERSATLYFQCGEAAMVRLRCLGRPGSEDLLCMMEKQPSTLTPAERSGMIEKIIVLSLTKGETQKQLLREYQGVHLPEPESNGAKIEESGNEKPSPSMVDIYSRYPLLEDRAAYTLAIACGVREEKARLLVMVQREIRRRAAMGIKLFHSHPRGRHIFEV